MHQAEPLAQQIRQLGGTALLFPTLDIVPPLDQSSLQKACQQLHLYQIIIFVSANAVHYALPLLPKPLPKIIILAVGPGTSKALQEHGITVDATPQLQHNTQGLLDLPVLQSIAQKNIAIFCGENSRPALKNALIARQARVDEVICYRRQCPQVDANSALQLFKSRGVNLIISTSAESLTNLCQLIGEVDHQWLQKTPLLVISPTMLAQARQAGFKSILLAHGASDQAILEKIKEHYENQKIN